MSTVGGTSHVSEKGVAMVIEEMTEQDCRAMLARTSIGRLGCAKNNHPYVVPTCLHFDGRDALYCCTTLGQKIEWMRQNPRVCVQADEVITQQQWLSLIVFGHYEELPPTDEYEAARQMAEDLFTRHAAWWEPAAVPLTGREQRPRITFRIHISQMTGRRAKESP
jgi:nitroimidazol reductase NimA-like FMN-containing flavoprotein (pyridoxamine 5'-phosphate oxidase superfamily)